MRNRLLAVVATLALCLNVMPVHAANTLPITNGNSYNTVMGGGWCTLCLSLVIMR